MAVAEIISERWPLIDGYTADQLEDDFLLHTLAESFCQVDLSNGWSVAIFMRPITNNTRTMAMSWKDKLFQGHNACYVIEHNDAWAALDYLEQVMHWHERTMSYAESVYQRMRTDPIITKFMEGLATKEER